MLLSVLTTLCNLLHHSTSSQQRGSKSKAMFFYDDPTRMIWGCKTQLSNILALLEKWTLWGNTFFRTRVLIVLTNRYFFRTLSKISSNLVFNKKLDANDAVMIAVPICTKTLGHY